MSTSLNRGRLRRPGRGLKTEEKAVKTDSINRLTHKNPDTPFAKDWEAFKEFVLDANASDAGAASAQEHLHIDLGAVACALLEKASSSQWKPDPRTWPVRDLHSPD